MDYAELFRCLSEDNVLRLPSGVAGTVALYEDPAAAHLVEEWAAGMGVRPLASPGWGGAALYVLRRPASGADRASWYPAPAPSSVSEHLWAVPVRDGLASRAGLRAALRDLGAVPAQARKLLYFGRLPARDPVLLSLLRWSDGDRSPLVEPEAPC